MTDLCRLAGQRMPAEEAVESEFSARNAAAEKALQDGTQELTARYGAQKEALEAEYAAVRQTSLADADGRYAAVSREYEAARTSILKRFENDKGAAEADMQNTHWEATAIAEAAKGGAGVDLHAARAQLDARWRELQTIHQQAVALLQRWGQWREFVEPHSAVSLLEQNPMHRFAHALELARPQFHALAGQIVPRFFQGLRPLGIVLLLAGLAALPAGAACGWGNYQYWVPASAGGSLALFAIVGGLLYGRARRRCAERYCALRRTLLEAGLDRPATLEAARADCRRLFAAVDSRQTAEAQQANDRFTATMGELLRRRERELDEIETQYPPRLIEIAAARQQALNDIEGKYPHLLRELEARFAAESEELTRRHAQSLEASRQEHDRQWAEMAGRWRHGTERVRTAIGEIRDTCQRLFPDWHGPDWDRWTPPRETPRAVCVGRTEVELARIPGGISADPRLRLPESGLSLPVLAPLPRHAMLLLKAADGDRPCAVRALQAVMLRLLAGTPPGKVRFTILDPVGLGENFSAFMHLADYEEQLVASRIWTDADHIEQRLADLTQHMENVIQVYLRNEFQTIQEYNEFAGEMAEPYRVLVVANFPANFSEIAAQRLKSIVASGARCGVFVLMSVDTRLRLPERFHAADLESDAFVLEAREGRFCWQHPDYGPLAVELDQPPPAERFTEIVRAVGHAVQDAGRVEVPFRCVIPAEQDWWTADSRAGIDIPLGRAGAMKLQHLELGKGTSQHVLISGKTGSGKSTLLHVLITNLALRYRPDEVELYLVDFKKGVEFKAYARHGLPHARVIAIESEREFGLSVLQRLDAELRARGDRFRKLGVQDLKSFRAADSAARLPRILLLVDEFQELFVEDDRIAQEAALLLDRLVRQGRAFGIHVILGSQTLGGAYSLARSTIGQMAVRIALQCSEADAHLILSEENTAARLLTRPGEAIYNDANGLYQGNHPFQVVWLPDDERDDYLQRLERLAEQRKCRSAEPVVFEGNMPADPAENRTLGELLALEAWPAAVASPQAWLGSAVAIKEPTAAAFVRQSGSNLLLVGHRDEASLGVLATCLLSLAAQHAPAADPAAGARFYILDGTRPDAPEAGYFARLVAAVPHAVTLVEPRQANQLIAELAGEFARRQQEARADALPPIYLFIYNLGRFRDLRKEDDYAFGGLDDAKPASPGKQFAAILREGPALGMHTLAWCESYATLNRLLDRQSLRDFTLRVLFQMNATDSSSLMDSPDAARLGVHRAILYDEARGYAEKFRPYGLPPADWLTRVGQQLHARVSKRGRESFS
ncbi:MAG: FtsK/SpoIIIE domain-containing protein [Thermoguttaceae bacterium]